MRIARARTASSVWQDRRAVRLAHLLAVVRRAPRWTIVAAATSAAAFVILALLVAVGATRGADLATTRAFQTVASDPLDVIVNAHTIVGQLAVTLPLSVVIAVVAWRRLGGRAWLGPLLILATGAIELIFKNVAAHPGPPHELVRAFGNPLGIPRELQPPFAFPSGHVARISFLALTAGWLFPSRLATVGAAGLVAFSVFARVYIGDHWISDVLGGLALGLAIGAVAVAWMRATARR